MENSSKGNPMMRGLSLIAKAIDLSPNYVIPVRAQCIVALVVTRCDACCCFEVILLYCFIIACKPGVFGSITS